MPAPARPDHGIAAAEEHADHRQNPRTPSSNMNRSHHSRHGERSPQGSLDLRGEAWLS